jgi:integrase
VLGVDSKLVTAATTLLLGVRERAVMDIMGWTDAAMVRRYAHVTARLRREIADRLDRYLWEPK